MLKDGVRVKLLDLVLLAWLVAAMVLPAYDVEVVRLLLAAAFVPIGRDVLRAGAAPDHVRLVRDLLVFLTLVAVIAVPADATSSVAFVTALWHVHDTQLEALSARRRAAREKDA